jgi:integrase
VALLLIGFFGALRRSELAGMRRQHLEIDDNGVVIRLPASKTSQDASVWVPILRQPSSRWDPVTALETWLTTIPVDHETSGVEGIWLRITKGDTFTQPPKPISADAINAIVARRVKAAGLDNPTGYSAHSLRAGFVTEAKNRGIDEVDIMKHSRHRSLKQMRSYDRTSGWWRRNATAGLAL